jgi:hypothetical protein
MICGHHLLACIWDMSRLVGIHPYILWQEELTAHPLTSKTLHFKTRQRRTGDTRFQPPNGVRLTRLVWLAERRLVARNPSLARQASEEASVDAK